MLRCPQLKQMISMKVKLASAFLICFASATSAWGLPDFLPLPPPPPGPGPVLVVPWGSGSSGGLQLPIPDGSPLPGGFGLGGDILKGGTTVAGHEIILAKCERVNNQTLNRDLLEKDEVSFVRTERLEAMSNIASAYAFLKKIESRHQLSQLQRETLATILQRLNAIPKTAANLILESCKNGRVSDEFKAGKFDIEYFDLAFNYLIYYSKWD